MAACNLRLYPTGELEAPTGFEQGASVSVRLGEIVPVLRQAFRGNYAWLRDFEDDEIRVTQDFYDVIRAFANLRPSA